MKTNPQIRQFEDNRSPPPISSKKPVWDKFLIARSIQLENGGFSSTECKNLLYLLDMASKVYNLNSLEKIEKKN